VAILPGTFLAQLRSENRIGGKEHLQTMKIRISITLTLLLTTIFIGFRFPESKPAETKPTPVLTRTFNPKKSPRPDNEQIISRALNELSSDAEGLVLNHPTHTVNYSAAGGVTFTPRFSKSPWNWRLYHYGSAERNWLRSNRPDPVANHQNVDFDYGAFTERYLSKSDCIEQRFVLREHPGQLPKGNDLVIRGQVNCKGDFDPSLSEHGWLWRDETTDKVVSLGQVTVFDAAGTTLPATMTASPEGTEITVNGEALLAANYPVTIDPEIRPDTFIGGATRESSGHLHQNPALAYNEDNDQFCVVWQRTSQQSNRILDICIQLIDASNGEPEAPLIVYPEVSLTRGTAVAYSDGKYLVAWNGAEASRKGLNARFISPSGTDLGVGDYEIPPNEAHAYTRISLCTNETTGGFMLCWTDKNLNLTARGLSSNGAPLTSNQLIEAATSSPAQVVFDPGLGRFSLLWRRGASVYLRQALGNGNLLPNTVTVTDNSASTSLPKLDILENELCVVWPLITEVNEVNEVNEQGTTRVIDVMGQMFSSSLTSLAPPINISKIDRFSIGSTRVDAGSIAIAACPGEQSFVVTWGERVKDDVIEDSYRAALVQSQTSAVLMMNLPVTGSDLVNPVLANAPRAGTDRLLLTFSHGDTRPSGYTVYDQPLLGIFLETDGLDLTHTEDQKVVFGETITQSEFISTEPCVTYDPISDLYTVAWSQEAEAPGDWQIMARQLVGETTAPFGETVAVSVSSNPNSSAITNNRAPAISRGESGRLLLVWQGDRPITIGGKKTEIHGSGWIPGSGWSVTPFRVSATGSGLVGNGLAATDPDIVYNDSNREFLVAWSANGDLSATASGNPEIYGVRIGVNNFARNGSIQKISNNAADSPPALAPALAYNSDDNEFFAVWQGGHAGSNLAPNEVEIIGQRLSHSLAKIGGSSPRISSMGPPQSTSFKALTPDIAYSPKGRHYLVVWAGQDDFPQNTEIFGQHLNPNGTQLSGMIQISEMGPPPSGNILDAFWTASHPKLRFDTLSTSFLVTWSGSDNLPGRLVGDQEIYSRQIGLGRMGVQSLVSNLGPQNSALHDAEQAVLVQRNNGEFLVVYDGNHDDFEFDKDRSAIFGKTIDATYLGAPLITELIHKSYEVEIKWNATTGLVVGIESSTDLNNWNLIHGPLTASGNTESYTDDEGALAQRRFYRVIVFTDNE